MPRGKNKSKAVTEDPKTEEVVIVEDIPVSKPGWVAQEVWDGLCEDKRVRLCGGESLASLK